MIHSAFVAAGFVFSSRGSSEFPTHSFCGMASSPVILPWGSQSGSALQCSYASETNVGLFVYAPLSSLMSPPVIPSDYSTQLTLLLRYPPPPVHQLASSTAIEQPFTTHHTTLLLRQALSLQIAPTVATGASVVYENRNLLNIASEVPEPPPPPMKRRAEQGRTTVINDGPLRMLQRPVHARYGSSGSLGLPDIAKNIFDRSESLGINRTVMNAVSEIKVMAEYTRCGAT